jgi:hypothetical protein
VEPLDLTDSTNRRGTDRTEFITIKIAAIGVAPNRLVRSKIFKRCSAAVAADLLHEPLGPVAAIDVLDPLARYNLKSVGQFRLLKSFTRDR